MGVTGQHLAREVPGNVHDGQVARAALREFCDKRMPSIVPPAFYPNSFLRILPRGFQASDWLGRV